MDLEALKKSFLKKFQEDTEDRLQKIQLGVLDLEKPSSTQAADLVARELHTMKGEARILGLAALGHLAHAAEDVLKAEREQRITGSVATDLLLRACDAVSDLLADIEAAKNGSAELSEMCAALAKIAGSPEHSGTLAPAPTPVAVSSSSSSSSVVEPRTAVNRIAIAESVLAPSPPPTEMSMLQDGEEATQAFLQAASQVTGVPVAPSLPPSPVNASTLEGPVAEPAAVSMPATSSVAPGEKAAAAGDRSIRVAVETLDSMGLVAGDLLVESARTKLRTNELNGVLNRFAKIGDGFLRLQHAASLPEEERAAIEALESELHQLRDVAFRFVRHHVDGLNSLHGSLLQLADQVAGARLVPLASVFEAFPRAVREMSRDQGKEVAIEITNPGLGVDRSMLQDVRDALVHLLRNSVDHGLERPEERGLLGKQTTGSLRIRVRADGDMLHLDIEDDGRGIDPEKLRQTAVKRGFLIDAQAKALSEREAFELVFRPGFSTREEITEFSGRGVGMDVVKGKVEALGGTVTLSSRIGRGTTVQLRLPQSLALMRVLLVRLGGDVYGVPAADVESVIRVKPAERMEVLGTLAVQHRGNPIALVPLGSLLGLNGGPMVDGPPAVVVRLGDERAALAVDGFIGEREVAVKPCGGEFLRELPFVAGSAALEDGRIAVLLKIPDVMKEVRRIAQPVQAQPSLQRLRVLLVDDSPIARATASALVRALGHEVDEAKDGDEGLQRARSARYDVIITDVQMPRMDGFTLTRHLKADPKLRKVPVIIISSLASAEDKRRGADCGANAYLVKGELGVESLAQAFERLV